MDRLDCDRMFVTVLETGSFSAAALRLGTSSSQASKLVSKLEQRLGVQLFKRSTRALSPTDVGRSYYERVKNLLDAFETLDASVRESATTPTGRLKISAPGSFGTVVLSEVLVAFARRYPLIELDVSFSDRSVNIVDEGFDMAIRIGTLSDSSLVARKLGEVHVRIAASPVYLEQFGTPQHWREMPQHQCIIDTNFRDPWHWPFAGGATAAARLSPYRSAGVCASPTPKPACRPRWPDWALRGCPVLSRLPRCNAVRLSGCWRISTRHRLACLRFIRPPVIWHTGRACLSTSW